MYKHRNVKFKQEDVRQAPMLQFLRNINGTDIYCLCDNHITQEDWEKLGVHILGTDFYDDYVFDHIVYYHCDNYQKCVYNRYAKADVTIHEIRFHYNYKHYHILYHPSQLNILDYHNRSMYVLLFCKMLGFNDVFINKDESLQDYSLEDVWGGVSHHISTETRLQRDFGEFPMQLCEKEQWEDVMGKNAPRKFLTQEDILEYIIKTINKNANRK